MHKHKKRSFIQEEEQSEPAVPTLVPSAEQIGVAAAMMNASVETTALPIEQQPRYASYAHQLASELKKPLVSHMALRMETFRA